MNFNFLLDTNIVFGRGARKELYQKVSELEIKNPCIITDEILLTTEFGEEIRNQFEKAPVFSKILPNPTLGVVNECGRFCKEQGCDGIIVLGGGSCIDTAKGASVAAVSDQGIEVFLDREGEKRKEVQRDILPVIAIPTTAGTGSEVSQYSVLTDEKTLRKESISSTNLYPKVAIVDSQVTEQLPKFMTACTGLDVLSHGMEALLSTIENEMTNLFALEAIKLVFEWLPKCGGEENVAAREKMSYASLLAGIAMSHCCGILPHGMGCPLSGHCQVPHGLAAGVLQIPAIELVEKVKEKQLDRIVSYVFPEAKTRNISSGEQLIHAINKLFQQLEISNDFKQYNVTDEKIQKMAQDAMVHGCTGLNPTKVTQEDIKRIYKRLA